MSLVCINCFKLIQIFTAAALLHVLSESLVMSLSYILLRRYAGGWHALSSINCSIISLLTFVGIPLLIKSELVNSQSWFILIISLITLILFFLYAPADTEKNPLVSVSERRQRRTRSLLWTAALTTVAFIQPDSQIRLLLLTGMFIESLIITPYIYKLTKRSYKNYENYEEEQ